MSSLGIYIGPKAVTIAEARGRTLISNGQILQTTISTGELGERVPAELKTSEIVALLKDELRRNRVTAREATLSLSGKDVIVRNFDVPILPRDELHSAINFEAKKYIPFKVEDLVSTFQVETDKQNQRNRVLFMGIKKDALDKYLSIVRELNLKLSKLEYSGFSMLRLLDLAGINKRGVIGLIGCDLQEQDEMNFVVLENGFPLFSRDISLAVGPEDLARPEGIDSTKALEKIKSELRVSLDFYQRRFPTKNIQKIYLITNPEYRSQLESSISEIGSSAQSLDLSKYIGKPIPFSLSILKGYSASLAPSVKINIKLDLLVVVKERARALTPKEITEEAGLQEAIRPAIKIVMLGILICAAVFGWGLYRTMPLKQELNDTIGRRAKVTTVDPNSAYNTLMEKDASYQAKIKALDETVKKQLYLTSPLNVIPRAIPEGVWLSSFKFTKSEGAKKELVLEGMASLGDPDKEFVAVNKFLSNLKEDTMLSQYFKDINVTSIDRRDVRNEALTTFSIVCRGD